MKKLLLVLAFMTLSIISAEAYSPPSGTGNTIHQTGASIINANLNTPSALNLLNATGYPTASNSGLGLAQADGLTINSTAGVLSAVVGPATNNTFTNKTFDTAGTGNTFKINGTSITSLGGNTGTVGTTSGTLTSGHCVQFDASGNLVDAGGSCTTGGGGGTVASSSIGQVPVYTGATTVTGGSGFTASGGVVTATGFIGPIGATPNTGAFTTIAASTSGTITSTSANALTVGANGATNPALQIDSSTASAANGLSIVSRAAGNGTQLNTISSGSNEALLITSKGTGSLTLNTSGGAGNINLQVNAGSRISIGNSGTTQTFNVGTSGTASNVRYSFSGGADTALTASTEAPLTYFNLGQTRQHATGTIALQRDFRITGSTHSFVGASIATSVAALSIDGYGQAGTNATITNAYGLYIPVQAAAGTVTNDYAAYLVAPTGGATINDALFATDGTNTVALSNGTNAITAIGTVNATAFSGSGASLTSLTAANINAGALANGMTATTQALGDTTTKIATDAFVANAINDTVDMKDPAAAATNAALILSPTYANGSSGVGATLTAGTVGVLIVDGYTPALNDRILVKNQASTFQNGCYKVTTLGVAVTTAYVLTRCTDYDQTADIIYGTTFPVLNGTVNVNQQFTMNNNASITVGTTAITYAQTSGGSQLTSGTGILITGNSIATAAPTVITNTGSPSQGDILYYTGSAWTDLPAGTSGNFLKTQGASANPIWAAPAPSSELVLLATATASTSSTLNFTSDISSSYSSYILVIENLLPSTTSSLSMAFSSDNGSTYAVSVNGSKIAANDLTGTSAPTYTTTTGSSGVTIAAGSGGNIYNGILNFTAGFTDPIIYGNICYRANSIANITAMPIAAFNAFKLFPSTGSFTSGTVYLYGVKNI